MSNINDLPEGPCFENDADRNRFVDAMVEGQAMLDLPEEDVVDSIRPDEEEEPVDNADISNLIPEGPIECDIDRPDGRGLVGQLQDRTGNHEAYEDVTLQDVRDMVADLTAENPPPSIGPVIVDHVSEVSRDVTQLDVSQIPSGMTTEDFLRHYNRTGVMITDTGTSVTRTTAEPTTDSTTAIPVQPQMSGETLNDPLDDLFVNRKDEEAKPDEEEDKISAANIAEMREERRMYHKHCLEQKQSITVFDLAINQNDLIIATSGGSAHFYHLDTDQVGTIEDLRISQSVLRKRRGSSRQVPLENNFVFDKNMNRLIISNDRADKKFRTRRDGIRIYSAQAYTGDRAHIVGHQTMFVVIDKQAFLDSKGVIWKIRRRHKIPYYKIMELKRMYETHFREAEVALATLKRYIAPVLPEEDFDIIYNFASHGSADFSLILKFKDIVIKNSIEMEHRIGEMIIRSLGQHYFTNETHPELRIKMRGHLYGTRMTFDSKDASANYQHSHLTSSMYNFQSFCTGSVSYATDSYSYINEYDLQEHILKIDSFIRWESLEGGPHYKMENITGHGQLAPINHNVMNEGLPVSDYYVKMMIEEVNKTPNQFRHFSSCFTIINQKGRLKFVADYQMFTRKFLELFNSTAIKDIHIVKSYNLYTYNEEAQTFHKVANIASVIPEKVMEKSKTNMQHFNPIYINGKYEHPHFVSRETGDLLKGMRFCFEPNAMRELAKYIMYHLTLKLEEYGISSQDSKKRGVSSI